MKLTHDVDSLRAFPLTLRRVAHLVSAARADVVRVVARRLLASQEIGLTIVLVLAVVLLTVLAGEPFTTVQPQSKWKASS